VFTSVPELTAAIEQYVAHHNANPKPFIWTATARDILQKVIRANSRLSGKQNAHYTSSFAAPPVMHTPWKNGSGGRTLQRGSATWDSPTTGTSRR
jgi:hypothetical protein